MKKIIYFFLLFQIILFPDIVRALSPAPPSVNILCTINTSFYERPETCLNDDCSIKVVQSSNPSLLELRFENRSNNITLHETNGIEMEISGVYSDTDFSEFLDVICVEDVQDIQSIMSSTIYRWESDVNKPIFGSKLIFEEYSVDKISEFTKGQNDYLNCEYKQYEVSGDWITSAVKTREYCNSSISLYRPSFTRISQTEYIQFMYSNLNVNTFPYVLPYIATLLTVLLLIIYIFIRKEVPKSIKPTNNKLVVTVILSFFTFLIYPDIVILIFSIFYYYLIISLLAYGYKFIEEKH